MLPNTASVKATCLIVAWLLIACGSSSPTPVPPIPIDTPTPLPVYTPTSLPTHTPIPLPTATPIPGYVGGEEPEAYTSFLEYYKNEVYDCYFDPADPAADVMEIVVDEEYAGKAIYVGDGIWRFYVQVISYDETIPEKSRGYKEEVIQVISFPDRSWENVCLSAWEDSFSQEPEYEPDYPEYEPYYPDYSDRPEYEPYYPELPDGYEDLEEPPDQEWP